MYKVEDIKKECEKHKGVTIDFPFDDVTMVFRVGEKMFALCNIADEELRVNLKCNPELVPILREDYKGVIPGYHMNKKHWNTVYINSDVEWEKVKEMIAHSYTLVFNSLTKKLQKRITDSLK